MSAKGILAGFWISPRKHPDFGWTLLSRVLVNVGNALGTSLLLYFLMFQLDDDDAEADLILLTLIYMVFVILASLLLGRLSDRLGRRKAFVFLASGLQGFAALLLAIFPDLTVAMIAAGLLGLGYGCFLSVDQALATQVLPDAASRGKDLGIMNIATAVPQAIAPLLGAAAVVASGLVRPRVRAQRRLRLRRRPRRRTGPERALMALDLRLDVAMPDAASDARPGCDPARYWPALTAATRHLDAPVGALHLGALRHNAQDMLRRAAGTPDPHRVASPCASAAWSRRCSRCPATTACSPTRWPRRCGSPSTVDDIVVGYPDARTAAASADSAATPTSRAASRSWSTRRSSSTSSTTCCRPAGARSIRVCLELDASWTAPVLGHLGVRRSPGARPGRRRRALAEDIVAPARIPARRHDGLRGADRRRREPARQAARSTAP